MSNRSTWIGREFRADPLAAREKFLRIAKRNDGVHAKIAKELGVTPRQVTRICWRESLWNEVDKMRAEAEAKPKTVDPADWLSVTRAALRGQL